MDVWPLGWLVAALFGPLYIGLDGWLAAWSVGCCVVWSLYIELGWMDGRLVSWLLRCLVLIYKAWMDGWTLGRLVAVLFGPYI